jgi:N-acetyl-anhydromuramyl-L-alanine amidase AmpD
MSKNQSLAAKLHNMENGISGVQNNPEIQERMSQYGYTPERVAEGLAKLADVKRLTAVHAEEYSDQFVATTRLGKAWTAIYAKYMITLKVVRVAFHRETGKLQDFRATGQRHRSLSGWLNDARILYTNLQETPGALETMTQYGYTTERLQEEQQQVEEVAQLHSKRLEETGAAQQSTQDRDRALDELCDWYSDFRAIVRVALYDKPQLLEGLGIVKK